MKTKYSRLINFLLNPDKLGILRNETAPQRQLPGVLLNLKIGFSGW